MSETSAREQEPKGPQETKGSSPFSQGCLQCHHPPSEISPPKREENKPLQEETYLIADRPLAYLPMGKSVFSFLDASVLLMFSTLLGVGRMVLQRERHDY